MNVKTPNQQSAWESLQAIESVLEASHRIAFPGQTLIAYGVWIALIPWIEHSTQFLSFGSTTILEQPLVFGAIHVLFYWAAFRALKWAAIRFWGAWKEDTNVHPLILALLGTQKTIEIALGLTVLLLCWLGHVELIFPLVFIFLAILFQAYGRFARGPLKLVSWLLLLSGGVYGVLLRSWDREVLWVFFSNWLGLILVVAGVVLVRRGT